MTSAKIGIRWGLVLFATTASALVAACALFTDLNGDPYSLASCTSSATCSQGQVCCATLTSSGSGSCAAASECASNGLQLCALDGGAAGGCQGDSGPCTLQKCSLNSSSLDTQSITAEICSIPSALAMFCAPP